MKISLIHLIYFPKNKLSKSVTVGPVRGRPVHRFKQFSLYRNIYFYPFRFILKVLEMFEYRRGDLYMTVNGNFVRFTHSWKCISFFFYIFFSSFNSGLNIVEATYIWLLMGTLFASSLVKIYFIFLTLFFSKFYSCLNTVEATYTWLFITS